MKKTKLDRLCEESRIQSIRFHAAMEQVQCGHENGELDFAAHRRMTEAYLGYRQVLVSTYLYLLKKEQKKGRPPRAGEA